MPEKMADTPSKTLEEWLRKLVRERKLSAADRNALLAFYHRDVQERSALAVVNALESQGRIVKEKDREIENLKTALEHRISSPTFDKKTGLLAGSYFEELLPALVKDICLVDRRRQDRRSGCPCLVMGDVRKLKFCNDSFGHDVGDALMAAVGAIIRQNLRSSRSGRERDWAARSNERGDEVEIFMLGARDPVEAGIAVSRIKEAFQVRYDWEEFDPRLNAVRPDVDFGAAAIKGSSLRGILQGLPVEQRPHRVAELLAKWRKKADDLMYHSKHERIDAVSFAWYEWDDKASEFMDITVQMSEIQLLHNLRR